MNKTKKKDQKRKAVLESKSKVEALRFLSFWGAQQKQVELTPETKARIEKEILQFSNLQLAADLLELNKIMDRIKNELGIKNEPTVGLLAGSMVAYCLGLEPQNPMLSDKTMDLSQIQLPVQLTVSYDNEIRQLIVDWLTKNGYTMSTFLGQPLIKLTNSRIVIRRVVKN